MLLAAPGRQDAFVVPAPSQLLTLQQDLVDYLLTKKHGLLGTDPAVNEADRNYNSFT